jgi:hypothetical protein
MPFGKWKAVVEELREQREIVVTELRDHRDTVAAELRDHRDTVAAELRDHRDIVVAELRDQRAHSERKWAEHRERSEREWALVRQEHKLARRQMERSEQQLQHEFELNRRAYEEGMALCAQLVERVDGMFAENVRAFRKLEAKIDDGRAETRAQTQALLRVIDRMDRLDGGTAAA